MLSSSESPENTIHRMPTRKKTTLRQQRTMNSQRVEHSEVQAALAVWLGRQTRNSQRAAASARELAAANAPSTSTRQTNTGGAADATNESESSRRYKRVARKSVIDGRRPSVLQRGDYVFVQKSKDGEPQRALVVGESDFYGEKREDGFRETTTRMLQLKWSHNGETEYVNENGVRRWHDGMIDLH